MYIIHPKSTIYVWYLCLYMVFVYMIFIECMCLVSVLFGIWCMVFLFRKV